MKATGCGIGANQIMRSLGVNIKPHDRGVCSLTSCSYCQNAEVNQRANNTVNAPAKCMRDTENTGEHGMGGDRDGNKDKHKADASTEHAGPPRDKQSACG